MVRSCWGYWLDQLLVLSRCVLRYVSREDEIQMTIDRLMRYLTALDAEVEIIVRDKQNTSPLHIALG